MDDDAEFVALSAQVFEKKLAEFRQLVLESERLDVLARQIRSLARLLEDHHGVAPPDLGDVEEYLLSRMNPWQRGAAKRSRARQQERGDSDQ